MKTMKKVLAVILIALMVFSFASCGKKAEEPKNPVQPDANSQYVKVYENGATSFEFKAVDAEGNEQLFLIKTDKTTVGDALLEAELIAGSESSWGLYVETVCGVTLDYNKDQMYWAFFIDGEYAMTGVDQTEVVADALYSFVATKG